MAQQHGVGDGAEEERTDHESGHREPGGTSGIERRGDDADHAQHRRDEIESGIELASRAVLHRRAAVDPRHLRHPRRAGLDQDVLTRHTCPPSKDG